MVGNSLVRQKTRIPMGFTKLHFYAEKGYARNLLRAEIISFHLIHFEPFQKLLFSFKGNIYFFIRFTSLLDTREKSLYYCCAKISTREKNFLWLREN